MRDSIRALADATDVRLNEHIAHSGLSTSAFNRADANADSKQGNALSLRPQENIDRGRALAKSGEAESALLAFQAALHDVLRAERPEDLAVRRIATNELLRLIRSTP